MKLTDTIYGIAYQNHRYEKGEYLFQFHTNRRGYEGAVMEKRATAPACKIISFHFRPIDLIGGGKDEN